MIEAVLFDLDGTLVNTIGDIKNATNVALEKKNIDPISDSECMSFVGNGLKNSLINALNYRKATYSSEELEELYNTLMAYYSKYPYPNSVPYNGIEEMLVNLKKRNIAIGVFSNKENTLVKVIVKKIFPNINFDFVCGRGVYKPKPDNEGVYAFLKKVNSTKEKLCYVGDSEVDYKTGKNSCANIIIVDWGFRDRKYLIDTRIPENMIVSKIDELEKTILSL